MVARETFSPGRAGTPRMGPDGLSVFSLNKQTNTGQKERDGEGLMQSSRAWGPTLF